MRNSLKHKFIIPDYFKRLSLNKKSHFQKKRLPHPPMTPRKSHGS